MEQGVTLDFGDMFFDPARRSLSGADGQSRPLRPQSAEVLAVLAMRANDVVTKEELFEAVWPDVSVTDDSLTQCIADIRKAIGDTDRTLLRTIPKKGYQLVAPPTASPPIRAATEPLRPPGRRRMALMAGLAVALLAVVLLGMWGSRGPDPAVPPDVGKASITVLPFKDLSPDASQAHLADGMTEDLITDLARWKEFQVTARNSAMTYKDRAVDIRQVARDMNTRYVLEGSVRRLGTEIRITAQLIDGETGHHVWADRFEETGSDVLALQDNVIGRIVQSLIGNHGVVREDEYAKTWARAEADLEEYDYFLRAHALIYRYTREDNAKAIDISKEGLARYPDSGLLKIKLAWGYMAEGWYVARPQHTIETVHELVLQGLSDTKLPPAGHRHGLWLLADVQAAAGDRAGAIDTVRQVVRAYPFDSEGLMVMVGPTTAVGDNDYADELAARALGMGYRPDPLDHSELGTLRYAQGDCPRAIEHFEHELMTGATTLLLAGCLADSNRMEEAQAQLAKAATEFQITLPDDFPEAVRSMPGVAERLTAQLAQADWPASPR
ncbi:winged helix-turn-helix domain-containing protein [Marivita sp.]|uniref:winged helix-turn-helix domain-containing protein n=2 Tax=Rhodobacterales TaxID=204455 RepID=UPI003A862D00